MMTANLEEIWNGFADKVGRFIRARVADPAAAEDIRQDVFVKIQARLHQLKDPAKLQGWIYHIARNAIIDHYRTHRETTQLPENLAADEEAAPGEFEELKVSFIRMIHSLPDPYREALVLTELEGLTQQQLADRQGISLSGAKSRVQRGRAQLKILLHECCTFEFDRRGAVIDCTPREKAKCDECAR